MNEIQKRFWAKVDKSGECWLWTGAKNSKGYGSFRVNGKQVSTHRLSYQMHLGDIPLGLCVCHKCDVRHCVNPDHLFVGTHKDNWLDAKGKGRLKNIIRGGSVVYGEKHGKARLTKDQVKLIRKLSNEGTSDTVLARRFSVARGTIYDVITRRTWKHI